jgi:polysaccharide export outer membrane protein
MIKTLITLLIFTVVITTGRAQTYLLSPKDKLSIVIFNLPEMTSEQRIDGEGNISLPLIGTINVLRKTVRDAELLIRETYITQEMLRDPQVSIKIIEYSIKEAQVIGSVVKPGSVIFPIETNFLDILDVIGRCGGLNRFGGDKLLIKRLSDAPISLSLSALLENKILPNSPNRAVYPGDTVYIQERVF